MKWLHHHSDMCTVGELLCMCLLEPSTSQLRAAEVVGLQLAAQLAGCLDLFLDGKVQPWATNLQGASCLKTPAGHSRRMDAEVRRASGSSKHHGVTLPLALPMEKREHKLMARTDKEVPTCNI